MVFLEVIYSYDDLSHCASTWKYNAGITGMLHVSVIGQRQMEGSGDNLFQNTIKCIYIVRGSFLQPNLCPHLEIIDRSFKALCSDLGFAYFGRVSISFGLWFKVEMVITAHVYTAAKYEG